MAPAILQQGCMIQCPHGGVVTVTTANARVRVGGAPALLVSDLFTVSGCPLTLPPPTPSPCLTVEWQAPAQRVSVEGTAVLLESSVGLCKNAQQLVQGTAIVSGVQPRVKGV